MAEFTHLVEIALPERLVRIWRLFNDGRKQLFTQVHFAEGLDSDEESLLLQQIAENILLDSLSGRALLMTKPDIRDPCRD